MYCLKCGREIPDSIECCPYCGSTIQDIPEEKKEPNFNSSNESDFFVPTDQTVPEENNENGLESEEKQSHSEESVDIDGDSEGVSAPVTDSKKSISKERQFTKSFVVANNADSYVLYVKKKIVLLVLVVIAAIILISCLFSFFNRPDLTRFIKVDVKGIDGRGSAVYSINSEQILYDVYGVMDSGDLSKENYESYKKLTDALQHSIKSPQKVTELSNGDVLNYNIDVAAVEKATGMSFKGNGKLELRIERLKKVDFLSIKDIFDVSYDGVNGRGYVVLTAKNSSDAPLPFKVMGSYVYIDDKSEGISLVFNGKQGSLSNGDTIMIGYSVYSDSLVEYISEKYNLYLDSGYEESFSVSGLSEKEELDVFSLVDIGVSGVEGNASINYKWKSTEYEQGNIKITVEDENSPGFTVHATSSSSASELVIRSDDIYSGSGYSSENRLFNFTLDANKKRNISDKDEITVFVSGGYGSIDNDNYIANGFAFKEIEHSFSVDSSMLDRYVTTNTQLNAANIKAFSETAKESLENYLYDNWSSLVHDSYSFKCYDQEIKSVTVQDTAYFACTNRSSNTYTLWMVYACKVKDSELKEEKILYMMAVADELVINNSTSEIRKDGSFGFRKFDDMKAVTEYLKYYDTSDSKLYSYKIN